MAYYTNTCGADTEAHCWTWDICPLELNEFDLVDDYEIDIENTSDFLECDLDEMSDEPISLNNTEEILESKKETNPKNVNQARKW